MRGFALLTTSMAILAAFLPFAWAQKPSPAGGGWLQLNGIGSFAVCEDNNSLDKKLNDFTIEAWINPKRKPERDEWWIIAAKSDSYELAFIGPNDRLYSQAVKDFGILFRIHSNEPGWSTKLVAPKGQKLFPADFSFNEWHHVAAIYFKQQVQLEIYVDGICVNTGWADMTPGVPDTPSAFYVGGTDDSEGEYFVGCRERSYFDGCIDEVRISNMARPINAGAEIGRFDADKRTQTLWHFDEPEGAILFVDSSGNGNTLMGRGSAFPVGLAGKLTTTLARIKSKY